MPKPEVQPLARAPFSQWQLAAALAILAILVYANTLGLGVAYDGDFLVQQDERIRSLSNIGQIFSTHYWWPLPADRLYRPITTLSFLFNYAVLGNGANAGGYHLVNCVLHALNVVLAFLLALRIFRKPWPAFFAAGVWAVHPIGSETVANIAGRADLLAATALLSGLLVYERIHEESQRPWPWVAALAAIAMFGAFSKEIGIVLVALMLLWDLAFRAKAPWTPARIASYAAVVASIGIWGLARARAFADAPWPLDVFVVNPLRGADFWTARLTALKIVALDLWLMVWPVNLASDRQYNQIQLVHGGDIAGWFGIAVVGGLLIAAIVRMRRDPVLFWAAGFFGLILLPASNLIVLIGSIMAERFLYLPALAFAVAAAALLFRTLPQRTATTILAVVIVLCALRTVARNPAWNNDLSLNTADIETVPNNFHAHTALAAALFQQDAKRNLDAALREQEAGWRILQDLPPGRMFVAGPADLGMYYRLKGDAAGGPAAPAGREWYEKAVDVLLRARAASQAADEAFEAAQAAHGKPPAKRFSYDRLYGNLGKVLAGLGRREEALEAYRYRRALAPSTAEAYTDLVNAYIDSGDWASAARNALEMGYVFGFDSRGLASTGGVYLHVPGGECAMRKDSVRSLNPDCPVIHADTCAGLAELSELYTNAQEPERARRFQNQRRQSGCGQ